MGNRGAAGGTLGGQWTPRGRVGSLTHSRTGLAGCVLVLLLVQAKTQPHPTYPEGRVLRRGSTTRPVVTVIAPHEGQVRRARYVFVLIPTTTPPHHSRRESLPAHQTGWLVSLPVCLGGDADLAWCGLCGGDQDLP